MLGNTWMITESCLFGAKGPADGAIAFIRHLQRNHMQFVILTNHSTRLRSEMAAVYERVGFRGIEPECFYTSTMAAVDAILRAYPNKRTAGYIGGRGMGEVLQEARFTVNLEKADWLFIGSDHHAAFEDYSYGLRLLEKGAQLIATDPRRTETIKGSPVIGSGSIVRMFEYAANVEALESGIPNPLICEMALRYLQSIQEDTIFVGGHLTTELPCGIAAGLRTVLVASGLDDHENLLNTNVKPDYVVDTLDGLLR